MSFATPRNDSRNVSATRRALEWSVTEQGRQSRSGALNSEDESPVPADVEAAAGNEVLTIILRGLQQQVSALQAQQSRVAETRTSLTPTVTTPNEKRKLPKELTVSCC